MTDHTSKIGFDPLETRYPAQQIYEDSNVAYYLASSGAEPSWCDAKARDIHKSFKELARALRLSRRTSSRSPSSTPAQRRREMSALRWLHRLYRKIMEWDEGR